MEVFKDDVDEIIFRIQGEISDLKEKKGKYIEKTDEAIDAKENDLVILKEVAKDLPEKQPPLFESAEYKADGREPVDITGLHEIG